MTTRTRYFVIASLLVMFVGVGTGLVAYYVGVPSMLAGQAGVEDLRFLPQDAHLVAYANIREVMDSQLRQKLRNSLPVGGDGQRQIAEETGINLETDIDRILACLAPSHSSQSAPSLLVIAHGRFDTSRIEALMRNKGAEVEDYKGARLIVARNDNGSASGTFAISFIEPGVAALGSPTLIRAAVDQKAGGGADVSANAELMGLLHSFTGGDAWVVAHFDELAAEAALPDGLKRQLPSITWFAASAEVDAGLRGTLRADTRDPAAAENLREVIRGFVALARMQTASQPDLKGFLDSLTLGGSGATVSLAFDVPPAVFDLLGAAAPFGHTLSGAPGK